MKAFCPESKRENRKTQTAIGHELKHLKVSKLVETIAKDHEDGLKKTAFHMVQIVRKV